MQVHNRQEDLQVEPSGSPFDLANDQAYAVWREQKLAQYPASLDELVVAVENPLALTADEQTAIRHTIARANMAIYDVVGNDIPKDKHVVEGLGQQFGLKRRDANMYADDDGISALQVSGEKRQFDYIPYSNRPISWHTDGYYNTLDKRIRGMILHCVRPAAEGGENSLVDHEIIYLQMRDIKPAHIKALMHPQAMTIPANIENGEEIRAEQTGPVFSVDDDGSLHMRYTARTRSIEWRNDQATRDAVNCLEGILASDSAYIFHHRLQAGQGIICNNVLHKRTGFTDGEAESEKRLFYRARFYDRVK